MKNKRLENIRIFNSKKHNSSRLTTLIFLILLISALAFTGCTGGNQEVPQQEPEQQEPETATTEYLVTLYYANQEYIVNGNEDLGRLKPPHQKLIQAEPEKAMATTLEELKTVPQEGYATLVYENIKINAVTLEDGIAVVDLSSENLNGSSLQETFLVDQIVETLTASFEEVHGVKFLVDGKEAMTLMGHIDATMTFESKIGN